MNIKEIGNVFHCDCGFSWHRGKNGNHNCADGLREKVRQLAAENVAMIRLLTDISDNHVEYFSEGEGTMFAGVPLDYVSEINMYVSRDVNAENPFPATDAYLAGIKADGVDEFSSYISLYNSNAERHAIDFAKQLREGDK